MTTWHPTPGQEKVRKIAIAHLPKFPMDRATDTEPVYHDLQQALANERDIREDARTGVRFPTCTVSSTYEHWLQDTRQSAEPESRSVPYFEFAFGGSVGGSWKQRTDPLYTGGTRCNITMRAILTLAAGQRVGGDHVGYDYYVNTRLLVGREGNHRLLGHILIGNVDIPHISFWQAPAQATTVRDAYRMLDAWWVETCAQLPPLPLGVVGINQRVFEALPILERDLRLVDAERVQTFANTTTLDERTVLTAYMRHILTTTKRPWRHVVPDAMTALDALTRILAELRALTAQTWLQERIITAGRAIRQLAPSPFERWYHTYQRTT